MLELLRLLQHNYTLAGEAWMQNDSGCGRHTGRSALYGDCNQSTDYTASTEFINNKIDIQNCKFAIAVKIAFA
jgi:hypothetical protein